MLPKGGFCARLARGNGGRVSGNELSGLRSRGVEPKRCGGESPFPPHSKRGRLLREVGAGSMAGG